MNKIISFSILYVSLLCVQILFVFISFILVDIQQYGVNKLDITKVNRDVGMWAMWILFYLGLPFVIIYFLSFKYVNQIDISYKPILFSVFNFGIFFILNFLSKQLDLPNLEFTNNLFWITCISIFVSPLILGQIPYFKKLMESI